MLHHPDLPLSSNDAERALRHRVIARRLSHGTRTPVGSLAFTLLTSVIDTCRQRDHSPWTNLVTAIADRRRGLPLALLPQPGVYGYVMGHLGVSIQSYRSVSCFTSGLDVYLSFCTKFFTFWREFAGVFHKTCNNTSSSWLYI